MLKITKAILLLGASCALSLATAAHADFVAYSLAKDGSKRPLPADIKKIEVLNLVNVEWGNYGGNKTRIGVLEVENTSGASTVSIVGPGGGMTYSANNVGVPVQGIEAMITDVMHRTHRFRLVERKVLSQTLREQDLGASGRIAKPSAAKVGKVLGAQYLFQAVVTNYESGVESSGGGLGGAIGGMIGGRAGGLLGGLGTKSSKAVIGMNFRLINAETSEVIYTDQVEVDLSESGLTFGGGGFIGGGALGGFMSKYSRTPIGQAVIAAINQGVFGLVKQVGSASATGSIIKVSGRKIYVNLGEGVVTAGDKLTLKSVGEELIDPDTGISLGGEEEEIGTLEVTATKQKYSLAKPVGGTKASRVKRGQKVVSRRKPEPLMFSPPWEVPKKKGIFGS